MRDMSASLNATLAVTYKANEMMQNIARDISVPEHPGSFSSSL